MAKGSQTQIVTKKHQARVERERTQNRYILIASISVIAVVIILLSYGSIQQYLIQPNQPVARVGDDTISTKEFQAYARYNRFQIIQNYAQYLSYAQMFGGTDTELQSYMEQYYYQTSLQLEANTLGQSVLDQLINSSLIKQYADENGITVTEEEIDRAIQEDSRYYPAGTPTVAPTREVFPTSTLSSTQEALFPPTSTATATATATLDPTLAVALTPGEEVTATATLAPTETAAPTETLVPAATATGPTPTLEPSATPTEYTQEMYEDNLAGYDEYLNEYIGISMSDLRWVYEMQLLREKVYEIITADIADTYDQVWVRHIVVADEETALAVLARLEDGANFAEVAAEVSTDTETSQSGGDLGWLGLSKLDPDVEKVAFNLGIGRISEPIETPDGWQIIQVLGHEVRQLTDEQLDEERSTAFQAWLDAQRDIREIEIFDIWTTRVPTVPTLPPLQ